MANLYIKLNHFWQRIKLNIRFLFPYIMLFLFVSIGITIGVKTCQMVKGNYYAREFIKVTN